MPIKWAFHEVVDIVDNVEKINEISSNSAKNYTIEIKNIHKIPYRF